MSIEPGFHEHPSFPIFNAAICSGDCKLMILWHNPRLRIRCWQATVIGCVVFALITFTSRSTLAAPAAQLDPLLPLGQVLWQQAKISLSDLLGMDGARSYLILVQNNQELRATGGFISAIGKLTLENGSIRELDFTDSYTFFQADLEYPAAPKPMQQYMNIQLLLLRDANWSPDFPTTAKLIQGFYTQQTGTPLAGVITLDLQAATLLVDAIGPLEIPGAPMPITGENFVEQVLQFWEKPIGTEVTIQASGLGEWWGQRKDFVAVLAQAARERVQSGNVNYGKLAWSVQKALRQRSIQIWVAQPALAQQLGLFGWDGALRPAPDADFVGLVDTNMGFNKVDAVLQRSLAYAVTWPDGPTAPALATAVITYTHPITLPNYTCTNTPAYGENYNFLIERCYYDYVRLYTPAGSTLESIDGVEADSVVTQRGENQTQYFAGYFVLPVGQQHTVTFRYRLPAYITPENYTLQIQRQSGANPLPVTITVGEQTLTTTLADAKLRWSSAP